MPLLYLLFFFGFFFALVNINSVQKCSDLALLNLGPLMLSHHLQGRCPLPICNRCGRMPNRFDCAIYSIVSIVVTFIIHRPLHRLSIVVIGNECTHSLNLSLVHIHTHTHTFALTYVRTHSVRLTHALTRVNKYSLLITHSYKLSHISPPPPIYHSHILTLPHTHTPTHSHSYYHTLILPYTHTSIHSHFHTLTLPYTHPPHTHTPTISICRLDTNLLRHHFLTGDSKMVCY